MTTHYERRGDVAVLQIDNPPVNGLGHATRKALIDGLERALDDRAVRAIVITGTDRVFSGGADIREFNTPAALAEPNLLQLIDAIERSPKAVIAAINGVCMGGGLELALGCNYRIATARRDAGPARGEDRTAARRRGHAAAAARGRGRKEPAHDRQRRSDQRERGSGEPAWSNASYRATLSMAY